VVDLWDDRLLTRAVLYRRSNVACIDLGITLNNLVNAVITAISKCIYPYKKIGRW
jgi:hypothetical protein